MAVCNRDLGHHEFRFYTGPDHLGKTRYIGKSPCRKSVKKLTPKAVLARAELCQAYFWKKCLLVDGKDHILDRISRNKANRDYFRGIINQITITPKKILGPREIVC
jgi:hypothetical protein